MRRLDLQRNLSSEGLHRLSALCGAWTVLLNHDARIVYEVGSREAVFGGAPRSSSIGRHIMAFVCPDDVQVAIDMMEAALAKMDAEVPFRIRAGLGDGRWPVVGVLAVNRFADPYLDAMVLRVDRTDGPVT